MARLVVVWVIGCACISVQATAAVPVTDDVWDVSQGTVIINSSGPGPAPLENMFGRVGGVENDRAFFRDDQQAGFTHFVEWRTPQPVFIDHFTLFAADDGAAQPGDRGFTEFRLFVKEPGESTFEQVFSFAPSNPYPGNSLEVAGTIDPVTAADFRAEFDQFAPFSNFSGPRIIELDGPSVPEPLAVPLMLPALALLGRCRRGRGV